MARPVRLFMRPSSPLSPAKREWLEAPAWQGVRRVMENLFVTRDWFELLLAQNLVFDGLVFPLIHGHTSSRSTRAPDRRWRC